MSQWDREGITDRLRELVVDQKKSFAETAEILNEEFGTSLSRSACIARAHRQGIDTPAERRKFMGARGPRRPKLTGAAEQNAVRTILAPRIEYPPVIDDEIPLEQRKTLLELTSETCRWPVGEGAGLFFCGAPPVDGHPYCGAHCARAYTKSVNVSDGERMRRRLHALKITHHMRIPGEPITTAPTATDEAA